jgi:outer membrane protein OmpA-like peptidoglycan-associated protein
LKNRIEELTLLFPKGQSKIRPGQTEKLRQVSILLAALNDTIRESGRRAGVEVLGHTDSDGTDLENAPLSQRRAEAVVGTLQTASLDALDIVARGLGSVMVPGGAAGTTEAEKERNRRVSFRVILPDAAAGGERRQ